MNKADQWRFVECKELVAHPTDSTCPERGRKWTVIRIRPVVAPGVVEPFGDLHCVGCWMVLVPWVIVKRGLCCELHNRHCEPPSELCCPDCSEAQHPDHPPGTRCVLSQEPSDEH